VDRSLANSRNGQAFKLGGGCARTETGCIALENSVGERRSDESIRTAESVNA
jgi:hypothetical protein